MHPKWTLLKFKETKWITTLRTAYTYGLNYKISIDINSPNNEIICLSFPSVMKERRELSKSLLITLIVRNLSVALIDI